MIEKPNDVDIQMSKKAFKK